MQTLDVHHIQVTSRFAGLTTKTWGGRKITSIRPRNNHKTPIITAMNPGESVVYQQKPCVILDATQEGFPLSKEHVLLEEIAHYSVIKGRVRYLAHLADLVQGNRDTHSKSFVV